MTKYLHMGLVHLQMPHESTVAHEQRFVMETPMISRSRTFKLTDEEEEHNQPSAVNIHESYHCPRMRSMQIS